MKITLKVASKNGSEEVVLTQDQILVFGRSSSADVKLEDGKISGKHCQIYLKKDKLEVADLDSKNVFLNGIRIEQAEIFLGDEVRLGDTFISIEEKSADKEASAILTFAGEDNKDKEKNDLRLDFTGARIANQAASRTENGRVKVQSNFNREVELRRKVKSRIKLSKEEIRKRNKGTALYATLMDTLLLFLIVAIPLLLVSYTVPVEMKKSKRLLVFLIIEGFAIPTYFLKNFKSSKFTFGEKFAGIEELFTRQ